MKFDLAFYSLHSAEASTCVANVLYKNTVFVQDNFERLNTVWQAIEQTSWTVFFCPYTKAFAVTKTRMTPRCKTNFLFEKILVKVEKQCRYSGNVS